MPYEIGRRIQFARKKAGMSAKELAEQLNISSSRLSNWENGTNRPDADQIAEISKILDVSADYLLGIKDTYETLSHPFTLAAHADGELDEEDMEEVMQYVDFIKNKKKKKEQE